MDYDDLLNEALAREGRQRFYEAAGGEQYFREREEREANERRLREIMTQLKAIWERGHV